jgi:SAM-dependent methyltransferase
MLNEEQIKIFGEKHSLKSLQATYQSVVEECFSGRRGIVECELIGESVAFKVRYVFELLKVLAKKPSIPRDLCIVDIGCERGDMLLLLQRLGFTNLHGVNLTPYDKRWLADGKTLDDYFGNKPGKIQYLTSDLDHSELPFKNGIVNIVILADVIEHLSNPGWVLSEINRAMSPKGLIVVGTPNIASIRNRVYLLLGRSVNGDYEAWLGTKFRLGGRYVGHTREYTLSELKKISYLYGFQSVRSVFVPTLVLLGNMRQDIPLMVFKVYGFCEKIWPGGRHRIVLVSEKTSDKIESCWIPTPTSVLKMRREKNGTQ